MPIDIVQSTVGFFLLCRTFNIYSKMDNADRPHRRRHITEPNPPGQRGGSATYQASTNSRSQPKDFIGTMESPLSDSLQVQFWIADSETITMDLPKVIIDDNYTDFLNGKEVEATVVSGKQTVVKGMHVMGFHNSIAINTAFTVPREKQSQYIGVEGMVTSINSPAGASKPHVRVIKL